MSKIYRKDVVAENSWDELFAKIQENLLDLDEEDSSMTASEGARRTSRYYAQLRSHNRHPLHTAYRIAQMDLGIHPEL